MVAISTKKPVFLSALLTTVQRNIGKDTACSDVLHDVDTISTLELCECLEALAKDSAALERMSSLCRHREWSAFYDYIKSIEISVDMWPMPSFDTHLIFCFCNLVKWVYEHTNEADFAYLYARILFDMAYEEIYQESLLDGIYTCVYQKADKAVAALLSAWKKVPNRTSFTRVLWGYRHKRKCHSVEYSETIWPETHPTPWVDEEIRCFLKSEEVTEEYIHLPECMELLRLISDQSAD